MHRGKCHNENITIAPILKQNLFFLLLLHANLPEMRWIWSNLRHIPSSVSVNAIMTMSAIMITVIVILCHRAKRILMLYYMLCNCNISTTIIAVVQPHRWTITCAMTAISSIIHARDIWTVVYRRQFAMAWTKAQPPAPISWAQAALWHYCLGCNSNWQVEVSSVCNSYIITYANLQITTNNILIDNFMLQKIRRPAKRSWLCPWNWMVCNMKVPFLQITLVLAKEQIRCTPHHRSHQTKWTRARPTAAAAVSWIETVLLFHHVLFSHRKFN